MNNVTPKLPTNTNTNTNTHAHSHTHTTLATGSRLAETELATCKQITFGAIVLACFDDVMDALVSTNLKFESLLFVCNGRDGKENHSRERCQMCRLTQWLPE